MAKVWRWLRTWWWTLVLGAVILGSILWAILRPRRPKGDPAAPSPGPDIVQRALEHVDRVRLEGEVEKARVVARAEAQQEELDKIEALGEAEPAEARRQVAAWLAANL